MQRHSIPNMAALLEKGAASLPACINFDSLKNKFAAMFEELRRHAAQGAGADTNFDNIHNLSFHPEATSLDMQAVEATATWLRWHLKMNLFGFDVCVEHATGTHMCVDVLFNMYAVNGR